MADDPKNTNLSGITPPVSNDWQQQYNQGGKFKEALDAFGGGGGDKPKEVPVEAMEEIPTQVELEKKPELAGYIEKIEKEAEIASTVTDDYTRQVLMKPAEPQNTVVTLPLTEDQVRDGLHHQILDSIRWLAEWCIRQIKMLHGKVRYKNK